MLYNMIFGKLLIKIFLLHILILNLAKNFIATFGKEFGMKTEENLVQLANGYPA